MGHEVSLGGDRLGSGKKEKVHLHGYERSTHDLSYIWRSTMASGTLVPFMVEVALPGDTFDIDLECDVKTHPTIGPLFGSYKVQLDVFQAPVRLYQGKLHMNMLGIGLKMQDIKLPTFNLWADAINGFQANSQVNPSSILKYLGISGIGKFNAGTDYRTFNAIPYLSYVDIYKQYYANKQEGIGYVIHNQQDTFNNSILSFDVYDQANGTQYGISGTPGTPQTFYMYSDGYAIIQLNSLDTVDPNSILVNISQGTQTSLIPITQIWSQIQQQGTVILCDIPLQYGQWTWNFYKLLNEPNDEVPQLWKFNLSDIDSMREAILSYTSASSAFELNNVPLEPYKLIFHKGTSGKRSINSTQEGLLIKTYQSDIFNNWIETDWIEGPNGINEITKVDTSSGGFTIDTLQLSRKVYDMLNRIAISGGTYDDWLDAVYTHERTRSVENPIYHGGLSKELAFQEVISNASSTTPDTTQPLGTLAGRGVLTNKHKGGKVTIKVDEPSYIIGIVSLTPRIDYSQGNRFYNDILTMDDFHKPAMDEIGFQDLVTDLMVYSDTLIQNGVPTYKSAGKQPAWINYMTNYNRCYGNFAIEAGDTSGGATGGQMYMTLNRRYEVNNKGEILDLTTYIDPVKFNNIFADTRLDAQNFWVQIGADITARRKMSAKVMPNL